MNPEKFSASRSVKDGHLSKVILNLVVRRSYPFPFPRRLDGFRLRLEGVRLRLGGFRLRLGAVRLLLGGLRLFFYWFGGSWRLYILLHHLNVKLYLN